MTLLYIFHHGVSSQPDIGYNHEKLNDSDTIPNTIYYYYNTIAMDVGKVEDLCKIPVR